MIIEAIALGFLVADFVYHRWFQDHPHERRDQVQVHLPRTEAGVAMPMLVGRCRARTPICAWAGPPQFGSNGFSPAVFQMNMFFVIGVGMADGNGTNRVHGMWAGDTKFDWFKLPSGGDQTGDGNFEAVINADKTLDDGTFVGGRVETLNGKPTQVLVDDLGVEKTYAGHYMLGLADDIPGYRGYVSVMLHAFGEGDGFMRWRIGSSPSVPGYSFEFSSYSPDTGYPATGTYIKVGDDCNPFNALYDFYVAKLAKIGIDSSVIDMTTWGACARTCSSEKIGYSRYIDDAGNLDDKIQEVLRVVDGVLRHNPYTGLIEAKLIRPDFNPDTIPHITKDNCDNVTGFAFGGWMNVANKVNIVFSDRDKNYNNNTVSASNPANAVRQDGQLNETTLQFPGICEKAQAEETSARELAARSVPIMKFRAHVDSVIFKNVRQGDAVKVTLSRPPISGGIFRVADVDLGTIDDGLIGLDLITDTSSYVGRGSGGGRPLPTDYGKNSHAPGRSKGSGL